MHFCYPYDYQQRLSDRAVIVGLSIACVARTFFRESKRRRSGGPN